MANFTRREIKKTFIQLLEERKYSDITIKDIVETCGISRSAFYYHYPDIPALMEEIIKERIDDTIAQYTRIDSVDECLSAMGAALESNKRAVMHIYRSIDRAYLDKQLVRLCSYVVSAYINTVLRDEPLTPEDRASIINYLAYLLLGFVIAWLESGMDDAMAKDFRRTIQYLNDAAARMAEQMKNN